MLVQHISPIHVVSPLIHDGWPHFLADYPDRDFVSSLLQIIKFGANIRFQGCQAALSSKNLKSAFQSPDFIQSSIDKLLTNGHAYGLLSNGEVNALSS
jgi:hypothetical protein